MMEFATVRWNDLTGRYRLESSVANLNHNVNEPTQR
jgi:hypothetical protein